MNRLILLIISVLILSCSGSKIIVLASQGDLTKKHFNTEIPFYYLGKYMYIDIVVNQKTYTFLFDTGWDITHIDTSLLSEIDFLPIRKYKTSGSSFEETKLQYGTLASSLMIGDVEFRDIGVGIQDMSFLKSTFPDNKKIYGIIGANVLRKAFWQIDYDKRVIRFSDKMDNLFPSPEAQVVTLIPKSSSDWGACRIKVTINGVTDYFVFDTGSYGSFSGNFPYLERLKNGDKPLVEKSSDRESLKRKFKIDELEIDSLKFKNQELLVEKEINLLIGNDFLEEFIVTIDWVNHKLYLESVVE